MHKQLKTCMLNPVQIKEGCGMRCDWGGSKKKLN